MLRRFTVFLVALIVFFGVPLPQKSSAITPVESFRDIINDMTPLQNNVAHDIYFLLPVNAQQITPSDYILIDLPQFSNVVAPTSVSGGYGTPNFSVSGKVAKITNIALLPGTGLHINGLTARNPASSNGFEVILSVSEDANGTTLRNQSTTYANPSTNQISVSATVETIRSAVNLSGFTSPSAFVTLVEGTSVIGTTISDGTGYFSFPIGGLDAGNHLYSIFSTDGNGRSSSQSTMQLYLLPGTLTAATGILLSPTISVTPPAIDPGDVLTLSGSGKPNSQINIFVESPLRSYQATTNASGSWNYQIPGTETQNYTPGQYRANVNVQDGIGNQSIVSPSVNFTVNPDDTAANPAPSCDISHGDLNCDGTTNIVDFSILLYHWDTNHRVADINNDGQVDLVDFSIMMYYYQS